MKKKLIAIMMAAMMLPQVTPMAAETTEVIETKENVINHGEMELSMEQAEIIRTNYLAYVNDSQLTAEDIIINYYGTFSGYDAVVIQIADEVIEPYGDWVFAYEYEFNFERKTDCERFFVHKDGTFTTVKEAAAWPNQILSKEDVAGIAKNFPGALVHIDSSIYPVLHIIKEKQIKQAYIDYQMEHSGGDVYKDYTIDDVVVRFYLGMIDGRDIVVVFDKEVADLYEKFPQRTRIGGYIFEFPFDADQSLYAWKEDSMMKVEDAKRAGELSDHGIWKTGLLYGDVPHIEAVPYKDVNLSGQWEHDNGDVWHFVGDEWYVEGVYKAYAMELMTGLDENTFGLYENVSRAQFITALYRLMPSGYLVSIPMPFKDVEKACWYASAAKWGYASDIIEGYEDGRFGPDEDITREQMATFLYRFASYRGYDTTVHEDVNTFEDATDVSDYAYEAMCWCVENGIIVGKGGNLKPQDTATRAECAVMITRFVEKYE